MKKTALFSILGFFIFVGTVLGAQKIAVLDFRKVFEGYSKTQQYEKTLDSKRQSIKKEIDRRVQEIQDLQNKIPMLKKEEQDAKKKLLENKAKELESYRRDKTLDLSKEYKEKLLEIKNDIEKVVADYAKRNNIDLVIDKTLVIYNKPQFEVTDKINAILSKKGK